MHTTTPYNHLKSSKKQQIKNMFNQIAFRYDFLNHILSMGIDFYWRKEVVKQAQKANPSKIIDLATGTADLAIALSIIKNTKIIGLDISKEMLNIANEKINKKNLSNRVNVIEGDGESIPLKSEIFDLATISFGIRNYENPNKGLQEINRVLTNQGKIIILEFSKPSNFLIEKLYGLYFSRIVPFIGGLFSQKKAYTYLPSSVETFPSGEKFKDLLTKNGFASIKSKPLTFGIVTIYTATKIKI